jgi:glycerol transport system ATP-binding protein
VTVEGATARLGGQEITLPGRPVRDLERAELGIRPEYLRIRREGLAAEIRKVEDLGRHRVVRAAIEGHPVAAILAEDAEIPADARIAFDPAGINLYAGSWRVELVGGAP